jgi:hypothetical protein
MLKLYAVVKNWDGYNAFQCAMRCSGFCMHEQYRRITSKLSGTPVPIIDAYWCEQSREYVTSLNGTESNTRTFRAEIGYRSPMLDQLASELNRTEQVASALPLEPGLRTLQERLDAGHAELTDKLMISMSRHRKDEADSAVEDLMLSRANEGCAGLFLAIGAELGGKLSRNAVRFEADTGVVVQVQRQPNIAFEERGVLTLDYWLSHRDAKRERWLFHIGKVLPGIDHYRVFNGSRERVHGIRGCLAAARVFATTFG